MLTDDRRTTDAYQPMCLRLRWAKNYINDIKAHDLDWKWCNSFLCPWKVCILKFLWATIVLGLGFCSVSSLCALYRNVPKFLDSHVWANSADPDQTAVWSGSTLFAIPSASFGCTSASFGCITLRKSHLVQLSGWLQQIFGCPKFYDFYGMWYTVMIVNIWTDRSGWASSVDPDQTTPWSGCTLLAIMSESFVFKTTLLKF